MIKLLLLIPTLDRSGAEKQLTLLATHLPREEFEVEVVALTRGGPYASELQSRGIPVTILGKRFKADPFAFWKLKRLLAARRPDILHTWLFAANAYGRLAAGKASRFPVIVSERCVDTWKSGWQLWLDRKLIPRTTRLVGNSRSVADFYSAAGVPAERVTVIPNAIEPSLAHDAVRQTVRQELGIGADATVVGYVGRLARQKRLPDLIWAFELLRHLNPASGDQPDRNIVLLIVGDGPERDRLEQFARDLHLGDQVRFTGHRPDAARLLAAMDVFWLASEFEGMSNSLMEALAAGLPVIVSDIPPNRELVVHEQTGYVVPLGDRVAFAQFTARLLQDREVAARLGTAARQHVLQNFSLTAMIDSHVRLYREIAHGIRTSTANHTHDTNHSKVEIENEIECGASTRPS